ncbi:PCMD domain-containing protein [Chitinophaga nivalis]|uniref:PCMD domain-containing protein n=1 Tax=Chitinophaga nivalis TaxID=2991709 RepID=A0ABT3IL19_9BACT|nr:PCMD domain-containing protein [Chitinophaga nivalis]MCW3465663.1 PCMD domain-containing protein [Chitinophaga nivalis]MCW3484646.1 PCMD domain-containing protein [Chitinophaga nivalis]
MRMNVRQLCFAVATIGLLQSCIKDAPQNPEADIETFSVDKESLTANVFIEQSGGSIRLYLTDEAFKKGIKPEITVSAGARVTPASGDSLKFDVTGKRTYTVTSASGANTKVYTVQVVNIDSWKFDFENWKESQNYGFFHPIEADGSEIWSSGNLGVRLTGVTNKADFPLIPSTDAYFGKTSAELRTRAGNDFSASMDIHLFAGSLFLGNFDLFAALENPLKATQFGQPYKEIPTTFTGYYKYQPGPVFQDKDGKPVAGKLDQCSMYAVLYSGKDRLDATNILTSDRVIATAILQDGTAKADWTRFEVPFTFRRTASRNEPMMMAIVLSSSKEGDHYLGAPDSRLLVDNLEIIHE